jgi:hypothetical protein
VAVSNETYKILFQAVNTVNTLLYTSPAGGLGTVVSFISWANTGTANDTVYIEVVPSGGTSGQTKQILVPTAMIAANTASSYGSGLTLNAGDMIYGYTGTVNTNIQAYGAELS